MGKIEGNVRLYLLLGTNQQELRLWGPKPLQVDRMKPKSQSAPVVPTPEHPCQFEKPGWDL